MYIFFSWCNKVSTGDIPCFLMLSGVISHTTLHWMELNMKFILIWIYDCTAWPLWSIYWNYSTCCHNGTVLVILDIIFFPSSFVITTMLCLCIKTTNSVPIPSELREFQLKLMLHNQKYNYMYYHNDAFTVVVLLLKPWCQFI